MRPVRPIVAAGSVVLLILGVSACSSGTSAESSTSPAAPSSAAPSSAASPAASAAASLDAVTAKWCTEYSAITDELAQSGTTQAEAQSALKALTRFDALWVAAGDQGYISAEEVAANQSAVAAFGALVQLVAGGAAADSPEVGMARTNLAAVTDKDNALLVSSTNKVVVLCPDVGFTVGASPAPSAS